MKRELESSVSATLARLDTVRTGVEPALRIGEILVGVGKLAAEQVTQTRASQTQGARFGETAIALGLVSDADVRWALSQQYQYPYALESNAAQRPELVLAADPFGAQAEVFRELRSQLLMGVMSDGQPRNALAVVSPHPGDGRSFFAANLAVAISQLGARTLLVDADLRTPRQHLLFGIANGSGLSGVLSGRAEAALTPAIDLPNLYVLPVGPVPPNPLELLQRPAFDLLLTGLLNKFDYVLVDTPAASFGADVRVIAATCGTALAVGREGKTGLVAMQILIESLSKGPVKLAGVALNQH